MGLRVDQKIVIVTRPTQLAALQRKFNTRAQAKFQIVTAKRRKLAKELSTASAAKLDALAEHEFDEVDQAAQQYDASVQQLRRDLAFADMDLPVQTVDRDFLPNFVFGPRDVVVTVGQDGLVANTAKYAVGLPIVAVNPDPQRIDGVLLPFRTDQARAAVRSVLHGNAAYREVTLAEALLADGQRLLAFNELFIGNRTHVSARYRLSVGGRSEPQSSSGVLVCTGAGSTGWLSSVFNMAAGVAAMLGRATATAQPPPVRMGWEDPRLVYVVREPFASKQSRADLVAGMIDPGQEVAVESDMPANGVIFSDGVESDYLEFNAGASARIRSAPGKARLVVGK
jgi:NAD kinase